MSKHIMMFGWACFKFLRMMFRLILYFRIFLSVVQRMA
jgi:hypothetical protein